MTVGYWFDASCPQCGGPIVHEAATAGEVVRASAVFACPRCSREFVVTVALTACRQTTRPVHVPEHHEWNQDAPGAPLIRLLMQEAPQ